jgi:CheY-like chemotaxis protein
MNGLELARQIRSGSTHKPVVLLFSSTDWSAIEDNARDAHVDKFLQKPLFRSDVTDIISACIGAGGTADRVEQGEEEHDDFTGHTILLADDVEINREIVLSLLASTHLRIECAENGVQAVKMFETSPDRYDMIFMDVQMPELDGYGATRAIRALDVPRAQTIPIIAMTANVFREDIEKCLDAGMNGHVGKPLNFDEVFDALRIHLS